MIRPQRSSRSRDTRIISRGRERHGLGAALGEKIFHLRVIDRARKLPVQCFERLARHSAGSPEPQVAPHADVVARLAHRRHVGQRGLAGLRGGGNQLHPAGLRVGDRGGRAVEEQLHRAGEVILHRVAAALVGHVHDVDAGEPFEELGIEMRSGAGTEGGVVQLARIRARVGHQLLNRIERRGRMRGQHRRAARARRHGREVAERIPGRAAIKVRQLNMDRDGVKQRVPVRRRLLHLARADQRRAARLVLDDDPGAQRVAHLLRDGARLDVGLPARRERHDDAHRLAGNGECLRGYGIQQEGERGESHGG